MRYLVATTLLALLSAGCPSNPAGPDATPCYFDMEWGPGRVGSFAPFVDDDDAELTYGFQGFLYIKSTLRMNPEGSPERGDMTFFIQVEGQEGYSHGSPFIVQAKEGEFRYADEVLVFFNDIPIGELVGKSVTVSSRVVIEKCIGSHNATVNLRNDNNCIEQPDGSLECPDAGL